MSYLVTKTYGHELGLSACFRQWKAESHCKFLHGYPLSFKFTFSCAELNHMNWVIDFGGLKQIKEWLQNTFDHKTLVATDDPCYDTLRQMHYASIIDMVEVENTGCEAFAKLAYDYVEAWLLGQNFSNQVILTEIEVREHGGNSAIYKRS